MINCSQSLEFSLWALKTLSGDSKSEMADGKGLLDVNLWTHVHPPPLTSIFLASLPFYCQVVGTTLNSRVTLNSHTFSMETHWMVSITAMLQNVCDLGRSLKVSAPHPPNFLNAPKIFDLLFLPKQVFKRKNLMP